MPDVLGKRRGSTTCCGPVSALAENVTKCNVTQAEDQALNALSAWERPK
jgi:hypothetical protein